MVRINNLERPILQGIAAQVPEGGLIVEIGSAFGYSATKMADASHESVKFVCVDPWTLAPQKQQPERERLFLEAIKPYGRRIEVIKAFSYDIELEDVLLLGEFEGIDLLFIDGDHSHKACSHDYLKFGPGVKPGGILVLHDYTILPGPERTVDELVVPSGLWENARVEQRFWIGERKHG